MNIFEIEKLNCRYKDKRKNKFIDVLEVEDISIACDEITVILGPSGSGKSTLMESISLMSDTIDRENSTNVRFYSDKLENSVVDLTTINKDIDYLQELRFENFCFIFQDTNIMGNFDAIENVALPKMVDQEKNGIAIYDAEEILIKKLGFKVDLRKKGIEYSGGQKQRFAFARAFLAKGQILFGDEPTGNLDKYNSEKLFEVINQHINSTAENIDSSNKKTGAIIVTHSIDLALQFADRIIVIVKPEKTDINCDENLEKGYSNPFLIYQNSDKNHWREEISKSNNNANNDLDDTGFLPPIDDDGSTRYKYIHENNDENSPFVKDRLKREIIFYLNNSYAHPQKVLVEIAKKLNNQLKKIGSNKVETDELFAIFNEIKKVVLEIVDADASTGTKMKEFDINFLSTLRERFINNDGILKLIPELPAKPTSTEKQKENNELGFIDRIKHPEFLYEIIDSVFTKFSKAGEFSEEFKKLFFNKEIGELYGIRNGNFWKIVTLYVILFVSVGFGIESKRFFNEQLNNPFVRFLPVLMEGEARLVPELVDSLQANFLNSELRKKYHLDTMRSISIQNPASFVSDIVELECNGIADDYNSPLVVEAVCSKENGYVGKPFASIEDRSVIVTLDLLKDLYIVSDSISISELTVDDLPGFILFKPSFFSYPVPLILQGVAKQLPDGHNFLLPTKFNDHLYSDPTSIYRAIDDQEISFYIDTLIDIELLKATLIPVAEANGISTDDYNFYVTSNSGIHSTMLVSFVNVEDKYVSAQMLKDAVIKKFNLNEKQIIDAYFRKYDFPGDEYASSGSNNQATKSSLLIVFDDLKRVKSFNEELKKYSSNVITNAINVGSTKQRKGIEMEMTNVNMRFILNIIEIIVTSFLIIIGILAFISLLSFIRVVFEKYFQKIEKNIGTFMAFGINIKIVYSIMLTIFIIITVTVSLVFAIVGGYLAEFLLISMLGNSIGDGLSLFSLYNIWTFVAIIAVVAANVFAFMKASEIFSKWPGDIINNR